MSELSGFIAGDTFGGRGNSHFANLDGKVICGTKNRFGMDCSIAIQIKSMDEYYTDEWSHNLRHRENKFLLGHLPINASITCKKCLAAITKQLPESNQSK